MAKLLNFQHKGVRVIDHYNGVILLADDMGLGKTIQALWWLMLHPEARPAVLVVPAHLTWHWHDEAWDKCRLRTVVLTGRKTKGFNLRTCPKIVIVSQAILNNVTIKRDGVKRTYEGWAKVLKGIKPKFVGWDEAHGFKNPQAKRTKALRKLVSEEVEHRIAITGTALVNRPAELWPTLNLLWPDEFPNFFSFAHRYCKAVKLPWGWNFNGASRLPELHARLKSLGMLRRLKVDVLKDLPPKTRAVLPVDIPMGEYEQARDNFANWLEKRSSPDQTKRALSAEKMVKLGFLKRLAATEKLPALIQWIQNYLEATDDKLAVYGIHTAVIRNGLYEQFRKISVCVDGDTPQKHRPAMVNKFQTDRKFRLFFGNIVAAGTGIGLVAAPHLLFAELDWVPGNHSQVEDRIWRIGQKRPTTITYLIARGTIEEELCKIIQSKQEVISAVLDGRARKIGDLDIYNQLTKYLIGQTKRKRK